MKALSIQTSATPRSTVLATIRHALQIDPPSIEDSSIPTHPCDSEPPPNPDSASIRSIVSPARWLHGASTSDRSGLLASVTRIPRIAHTVSLGQMIDPPALIPILLDHRETHRDLGKSGEPSVRRRLASATGPTDVHGASSSEHLRVPGECRPPRGSRVKAWLFDHLGEESSTGQTVVRSDRAGFWARMSDECNPSPSYPIVPPPRSISLVYASACPALLSLLSYIDWVLNSPCGIDILCSKLVPTRQLLLIKICFRPYLASW